MGWTADCGGHRFAAGCARCRGTCRACCLVDPLIDWLVLTGGASSRLGQDKASTPINGRTMFERACDAIRSVDPEAVLIELGSDVGGGPAAAVVSALPSCTSEFVGVVAVDMPMVRTALGVVVDSLAASSPKVDAWIPISAGGRRQWLSALYRRESLLRAASNRDFRNRPFHELVDDLSVFDVSVPSDVSLLDVDTPADLERAIAQVEGSEPTR